jgi:septum formation protein
VKRIVLASASERRARILSECGIRHEVVVSGADEDHTDGTHISDIVVDNSVRKAEAVAAGLTETVVIGADTLVAHGDDIIGKPGDEGAARELLRRFSGSDIEVYTGLCVIDTASGRKASGVEKSGLTVIGLAYDELERYFRLLAPYDKAGGFSIEGAGSLIFDDIRGSYFNILGLPMIKLAGLFKETGIDILDFINS